MAEPSRDERLESAIAGYYQAIESGQPHEREAFLARYPDLRTDLEVFLNDKAAFERRAGEGQNDTLTLPQCTPDVEAPGSQRETIRYFGDYELLEEIARGGMGVVFKARQVSLNRTVAVKMILAGNLANASDVQRFRAEAEAAANLDHPHILPIYEVGEHEGQHYFSMKLIEGGDLAARIREFAAENKEVDRPRSSSLSSIVNSLATVARAVHYAHQRGILHRDLKPANILLDRNDTPFVTDFGLAKRVEGDSSQTQSGAILGTPSYMAPEQARAEKQLSTAVDVYSLGAILYECLTGRPPFRGPTPLDTLLAVLEREPDRPTKCDRDLATIAMKCLEKEPTNRYDSAAAMADDLERWVNGEPIAARPPRAGEKIVKWVKRQPAHATLIVVLFCWILNLRLEWSWIATVAITFMVSLEMAQLALLVAYACGRPLKMPGDYVVATTGSIALLPASLIVIFYPASMSERWAMAAGVVLSLWAAGFILRWLWSRRQAGPLLIRLCPYGRAITFGMFTFACVMSLFAIPLAGNLSFPRGERNLVTDSIYWLTIVTIGPFLFLLCGAWCDIRQNGYLNFLEFRKWEDIQRYEWSGPGRDCLSLHVTSNRVAQTFPASFFAISTDRKAEISNILEEHLHTRVSS